jgi:hypothetical protein
MPDDVQPQGEGPVKADPISSYSFIVEANHLFKASTRYNHTFYVRNVICYLERVWLRRKAESAKVLYGTFDQKKAAPYVRALESDGFDVIDIPVIPMGNQGHFDTLKALGAAMDSLPPEQAVVLVGFHHMKFLPLIQGAGRRVRIAAFTTQSSNGGMISIPRAFIPFVDQRFLLDYHVEQLIDTPAMTPWKDLEV